MIGAGTDQYISYSQRGGLHITAHTLEAICELFPIFSPPAHAAQLGRHRRRHARPLADHRQDAGARASTSIAAGAPAASRRRRARATSSPHTIAHGRAASDRRAVRARPLPHRPADRRSRRRRGRALRHAMLLDPLPVLRPAPRDRVPLRRRGAYRAPGRPVAASTTSAWAELPVLPQQPQGPARRALAPRPRLRPLVQRRARHRQRPVSDNVPGRETATGRTGEASR